MTTAEEHLEFDRRFREATATHDSRAPLYAALSTIVADDHDLSGLLEYAPPTQRLPVLLYASVHYLLIEQPDQALAAWYPSLTATPRAPDEPQLAAEFKRFVTAHHDAIAELLATRSTQTNDVGRCALFLPPFLALGAEFGPLAHIDVGCSGGLTLLVDRYHYRYAPAGGAESSATSMGPPSAVRLAIDTRGDVELHGDMPLIAARVGLDANPIDVGDPSQARWLEACVWPDQADRFQRLHAAIEVAQATPRTLITGDAIADLASAIDTALAASTAHPVVTNSWVLNYLTGEQQTAYVAELDRIGAARDLSWVVAESPQLTGELPWPADAVRPAANEGITVTMVVTWRNGIRTAKRLYSSHPHGYWIDAS